MQIKQLAWPMAERQIEHRKSCLVLSARFPVVNWPSCPVAKSALISKGLRPLPSHIPDTLSIFFFPHSSTTCSLSFFHTRAVVEEVVVLGYTVYRSVADLGEDLGAPPTYWQEPITQMVMSSCYWSNWGPQGQQKILSRPASLFS